MDSLTDILNSIFVDSKTSKKIPKIKNQPEIIKVENNKSVEKLKSQSTENIKSKSIKDPLINGNIVNSAIVENNTSKVEKLKSQSTESIKVENQKSKNESNVIKGYQKSKTYSINKNKKSTKSSESNESTESTESTESSESTKSKVQILDNYVKDEILNDEILNVKELKKYIIKSNELYKRNILIVNKDFNSNLSTVSDILYKLGNQNNLQFENVLNILTFGENKRHFKKLLIENPNIFFTNLNIKTSFTKSDLNSFLETQKKSIVLIDFDYFEENFEDALEKISRFFDKNIYLIVLSTAYSSYTGELYKRMNQFESTLFMNTKDKVKLLQKKLYNKIIKNIIIQDYMVNIDEYIALIEKDKIKNIIIKSGDIRYC
jgi:hypothetical protein